jgi:hypothetical protein
MPLPVQTVDNAVGSSKVKNFFYTYYAIREICEAPDRIQTFSET